MGAESYKRTTRYQHDVSQALSELQRHVFEVGEYRYSDEVKAIGSQGSIDDARELAAEEGTKSVLDIYGISDSPDIAQACPLTEDELLAWFGTTQIEEDDIEKVDHCAEFWRSIGRGEARYLVLYQDGVPSQYYFAGYTFD